MQISMNHIFWTFLDRPESNIMTNVNLKDKSDEYIEVYNIVSGNIYDEIKVSPYRFKGTYHFNMLDNTLYLQYVCNTKEDLKIIFKIDLYKEPGRFSNVPLAINCFEYEKIFSRSEKDIPPTYDSEKPLKLKLLSISIQGNENNYLFYLDLIKELMSNILKTEYNDEIKDLILRTTTVDKKIVSECTPGDKITELVFNNDHFIIDDVLFSRRHL